MSGSMEMPRYRSHKEVWALEIASVEEFPHGEPSIIFSDARYAPVKAEPNMFVRHKPKAGDFYVVYKDGYKSISPRQEFLDGYERI